MHGLSTKVHELLQISFLYSKLVMQISDMLISQFKYLGHIISDNSDNLTNDEDIQRELKSMFVRTNVLFRKFSKCSVAVKLVLFKSFCLCVQDIALWKAYKVGSLCKFRSCYYKMYKDVFWLSSL